ncbi:hypothetical protein A2Z22_03585 [Candidatus Woesebacteria bacterium RBG_16_34_12]|uniref:5'-3' exonuclease domain-containing protein n=1 Tax=Candidatus Woesebacteria bacterium RBG_16_34_12 TaxID=1802480 RepID=A0A1F7XCV0_9BACT|nr:MAG: hypothetical protein A2Z22_03585 [Candidatus Woesebacteria bacterium RBG_16_34_12]
MGKLVLIDGNAILHRAYHALPKTLTSKSGEPINALYGFVSMLLRIIQDLKPTHIAVCFDRKEPTFRHKQFPDYQAQRPKMDEELSSQFDKTKQVIKSFGIPIYEKAGYEADDLLGSIAKQATSQWSLVSSKRKKKTRVQRLESRTQIDEVVIVTGDRDILQLVEDKVKVYLPIKGLSESQLLGEDEVIKKMGVKPDQIDDYKALVGDQSDNYPGVLGIGPKTTISLLSKFKSKQGIYKNLAKIDSSIRDKLEKGRESADISYELAKIVTDVDIKPDWEEMDDWSVGEQETLDLFSEIGFKTLAKRIIDIGKKIESEKQGSLFK